MSIRKTHMNKYIHTLRAAAMHVFSRVFVSSDKSGQGKC